MANGAQHTEGPWRRGADLIRVHADWRDENGSLSKDALHRNGFAKTIASVGKEDGDWRPIAQQVADATLIAAAPELLAALIAHETAQAATDEEVELIERACAEGWDSEPTGSSHLTSAQKRASDLWERAIEMRRTAIAKATGQ